MKRLTVLPAMLLITSMSGQAQEGGPTVGDKAPEFQLPGSDGKEHSLTDYRGKPIIIAWFPKAFTGGWTIECKSLRDSGQNLYGLDVVFFAASVDDAETNRKFAESLEVNYPILSDVDKKIASDYGVLSERGFANRVTVYIDKKGLIRYIDREVNVRTAGEDVLARVKELGLVKE